MMSSFYYNTMQVRIFFYIANYSAADPSSIENIPTVNISTDISAATQTWGGHTYKLFDENLSWTDARARCESMGGYLACITSNTEQSVIASLVQNGSKGFYWLSGSDADSESSWKWVTGQPNYRYSGRADYPGISRVNKPWTPPGEWRNYNNQSSIIPLGGFICEIDHVAPTTSE